MVNQKTLMVSSGRESDDVRHAKARLQADVHYPAHPLVELIARVRHEGCEVMAHSAERARRKVAERHSGCAHFVCGSRSRDISSRTRIASLDPHMSLLPS